MKQHVYPYQIEKIHNGKHPLNMPAFKGKQNDTSKHYTVVSVN
jgi:hypothetical protein